MGEEQRFQTCAAPTGTCTPGKLPEQLKAQSWAEPPWQGLMFQVPLPSGRPPNTAQHTETHFGERPARLLLSGQDNELHSSRPTFTNRQSFQVKEKFELGGEDDRLKRWVNVSAY